MAMSSEAGVGNNLCQSDSCSVKGMLTEILREAACTFLMCDLGTDHKFCSHLLVRIIDFYRVYDSL